jgi:hypothetical protein
MIRIPTIHRTPLARRAATGLSCLLLAACGGGDRGPAFAARDSAGVRIVESRRPAWAPGEEWTVGPAPLADVPVGRTPFVAARLGDGRIGVVADQWTVTLFGSRGEATKTVARPAGWPEAITWVGVAPGDSLLVWQPRRLSVFAPDGTLAREVRPRGLTYLEPRMLGRLSNGTYLVTGGHQLPLDAGPPERRLVAHLWVGARGEPLGRFADIPDVKRKTVYQAGAWEVPFSTRTLIAVSGAEVLVGDNADFEIASFGTDGALRRVVRRIWTPLEVKEADVEAHHARLDPPGAGLTGAALAEFQHARRMRREWLPHDSVFPAFTGLLAGADGTVWAEEPRHLHDYWPRWSVFDAEGRWLGTVKMPAGFALQQVGNDWVLGMEPDGRGLLHARVYPLVRPAGGGSP